jgi:molybdopterin/thiamine biosynthesis adenylyltransferase
MLWRPFDKNRLKVAAGGCGGRGQTADPNLMAMGIESFFVCNLLILHGLRKSEKSENRS